jgi:hypothetical protein
MNRAVCAEIWPRWLIAIAVLAAGTCAFAYALDHELTDQAIALFLMGPMTCEAGWFITRFLSPYSTLGPTLILFGHNFLCGALLNCLQPAYISFDGALSNGTMLCISILAILFNNWQVLYHEDRRVKSLQALNRAEKRRH